MGLDTQTWNRLARDVDLIVHPAAHVNHMLPYDQLFGPNVVGTAELIRLALTTRLKTFNYVSTVGVVLGGDCEAMDEHSDIRWACPQRSVDRSYANDYATSKWTGEVLTREAHDLFGLPVAVFRSNMILAHRNYAGQLNVPDMFTRLMVSVLATGIAPRSFYQAGSGTSPHYDGLPVDFVAAAIATLGRSATAGGYHVYNVVNPHDDGVSLDRFVDWLIAAGHPIDRIDDYDEWLVRFRTALNGLPDHLRRQSVLALLEAYAQPQAPVSGSLVPASRFREGLRTAGMGEDGDIPHLSADLIGKYATDLESLGIGHAGAIATQS